MSSWGDTVEGVWQRIANATGDFASSVSQTAVNAAGEINSMCDQAASTVAKNLPPSLSKGVSGDPPAPPTFFERMNKKWLVATGVVGGSVAIVALWKLRSMPVPQRRRRRTARRAPDGGRKDVVLIGASPYEPLVRVIAQDLMIRGFIVYITSASPEEDEAIHRERSSDIRALRCNMYNPSMTERGLHELEVLLQTPVTSFAGAETRFLSLAAVILIPDLFYPTGPLEATSSYQWAQTISTKILGPINLLTCGGLDMVRQHASRVILLTPSIISSLNPAFHAAESICVAALSSLALVVSREVASQHISMSHLKLGSFDTSHGGPETVRFGTEYQIKRNMRADVLSWPEHVRHLYAGAYAASAYLQTNRTRGSRLRRLFSVLFDTISLPSPPRVVHVGKGSHAYDMLTTFLPEWLLTLVLSTSASVRD